MTTRVSVIVPVYNDADHVGEAIGSLLAQDYDDVEVIVVDDGSTDGTPQVVAEYPQVRRLCQRNGGPARARNLGLRAATGTYVAFLDADDLAPENKLSYQIGHLRDHPDVDAVLGRQRVELEDGVEVPEWLGHDPVFGDLGGVNPITVVARREVIEDVGGFDEGEGVRGGEDRDLLFRLRTRGARIDVLSEVVLIRRIHGQNISYATRAERYPILRSLRSKLERERSTGDGGAQA